MKLTRKIREHKGASAVEFAIVLPLLMVLVFGIIEFGILLYDKAVITNASREGARAGIVFSDPRIDKETIISVAKNYCIDHLISFDSTSALTIDASWKPVTEGGTGQEAGDSLTVTVDYPFHFLVFSNVIAAVGGNIGNLVNLHAESTMRLE